MVSRHLFLEDLPQCLLKGSTVPLRQTDVFSLSCSTSNHRTFRFGVSRSSRMVWWLTWTVRSRSTEHSTAFALPFQSQKRQLDFLVERRRESTNATASHFAPDNMSAQLATVTTTAHDSSGEEDPQHCLVCYGDLTYSAVTSCEHNEICPVCHLRLRHLHKDTKCPVCKTVNDKLIVDLSSEQKPYTDYPIWGDQLGSDYLYREDVGMFFPGTYYEKHIEPLFGYHCTLPSCGYDGITPDPNVYEKQQQQNINNNSRKPATPLRGLQDHLRNKHRLALCQLCVDHKRDFVSRLPRFKPDQLKKHLQTGDGAASGFRGHPVCEFCRPMRFYDLALLHMHLQKEHYECHVCKKQEVMNQFFKNYSSLEKHFDRQHWMCHDVQCLTARFVVFDNELDLRHHERQVHGGTSTGSSKIQLEFRVRRTGAAQGDPNQEVPSEHDFNYSLAGQAFVPQALPRQADSTLHPMHVQRTALLQEQAAAIREANGISSAESFPVLGESEAAAAAAGGDGLRVGWASSAIMQRVGRQKPAGAVTEEDFPTLGKSSGSGGGHKYPAVTAKLRDGIGASSTTQRHFNAMKSAANNGPLWGGTAVAEPVRPSTATSSFLNPTPGDGGPVRSTQANLSSDNFPSLGGSSGPRHNYSAAHTLAKRQQAKQTPSWDSASDFPPPPSASQTTTTRQQFTSGTRAPSQKALANVIKFKAPSSTSKASVEDMKATLGSARWKELKKLTRDFCADDLAPDAYVDHAAALFHEGYGDPDFWSFVPSLLESCPNEFIANQATQYMENLRKMRNGALNAESTSAVANANRKYPANNWSAPSPSVAAAAPSTQPEADTVGGWSSVSSRVTTAPPPSRAVSSSKPATRYVPPPARGIPGTVPGKGKSAWGGASGASTVVRTKAPPGSVTAAAARVEPKPQTATKFMAKESKQSKNVVPNNNNDAAKKKKKQKDELRSLAFG